MELNSLAESNTSIYRVVNATGKSFLPICWALLIRFIAERVWISKPAACKNSYSTISCDEHFFRTGNANYGYVDQFTYFFKKISLFILDEMQSSPQAVSYSNLIQFVPKLAQPPLLFE